MKNTHLKFSGVERIYLSYVSKKHDGNVNTLH